MKSKIVVTFSRVYEFDITDIKNLLVKEEKKIINENTLKEKAEELARDIWYEEASEFLDNIDDFISAKVKII